MDILYWIYRYFFRESTFVAFDKSAFITSCATQSDKLFRKVIAMHGFLAACTSWARQHAETTAFAANGSHSIGILKEIRKSLKSSNLKTKSHLTLKGRRICLNSPHSFIFSMASASQNEKEERTVKVIMRIISITNHHFLCGSLEVHLAIN